MGSKYASVKEKNQYKWVNLLNRLVILHSRPISVVIIDFRATRFPFKN